MALAVGVGETESFCNPECFFAITCFWQSAKNYLITFFLFFKKVRNVFYKTRIFSESLGSSKQVE